MCGITVLINTENRSVPSCLLQKMNNTVTHRGPDSEGYFCRENFAMGSRRLSILDTSEAGNQPFKYGDNVIIYNGAVYNYIEVRKELRDLGYVFSTGTDTEVILAAYQAWGSKCVDRFNGMWAFVIYDPKRNILFCSRDRYGIKPFHYAQVGPYFTIGSEIKQFTEIPGFAAKMNAEVAFNFLNYSALNYSADTFFENVYSLKAGHNMVYDLSTHKYSVDCWYNFDPQPDSSLNLEDAAEQFRSLFKDSVSLYTRGDVKLGACLSGGLDSSSIVCMLKELMNGDSHLTTISVCWDNDKIDEREYIDPVLQKTGFCNKRIFPDINNLNNTDVLDRIIHHQDQPIPCASHFVEYKLYEGASKAGITMLMDGQGSDEYLAGYSTFNLYYLLNLFEERKWKEARTEWSLAKEFFDLSHTQLLKFLLYMKYMRPLPMMDSIVNMNWGKQYLGRNPFAMPRKESSSISNFSYHQLFISSLPYQLHSSDRNSMSHSVETRLPFLDHRLVEFVFSLPDEFRLQKSVSKRVLREAMKSLLPESVRNRKYKLGLPAPEHEWMHENAEWVQKELDESAGSLGKLINKSNLQKRFRQFMSFKDTDSATFFRVISLSRWAKIFNVSLSQLLFVW